MSDQHFVKGITLSTTDTPSGNTGKKRIESDGTNLFFNGTQLQSSGNVFDVSSCTHEMSPSNLVHN